MTVNEMREFIGNEYPGEKWRLRVANMSNQQVYAIYRSITSRHKKRDLEKYIPDLVEPDTNGRQLNFWDIWEDI